MPGLEKRFVPEGHFFFNHPATRYWAAERRAYMGFRKYPRTPRYFQYFDWVWGFSWGWAPPETRPARVFCHPNHLGALLDRLGKVGNFDGEVLALGGEDTLLSSLIDTSDFKKARRFFRDIFIEGFDIEVPGVRILPIGFTEFYLRGKYASLNRAFARRLAPLSPDRSTQILAAWGKFWPHLDGVIEDRAIAGSVATKLHNVDNKTVSSGAYFRALSSHAFAIAPLGNGAQSPKIMEALFLGAIPVMTNSPTARALSEVGVPLRIVEQWEDLQFPVSATERRALLEKFIEFDGTLSSLDRFWRLSFG